MHLVWVRGTGAGPGSHQEVARDYSPCCCDAIAMGRRKQNVPAAHVPWRSCSVKCARRQAGCRMLLAPTTHAPHEHACEMRTQAGDRSGGCAGSLCCCQKSRAKDAWPAGGWAAGHKICPAGCWLQQTLRCWLPVRQQAMLQRRNVGRTGRRAAAARRLNHGSSYTICTSSRPGVPGRAAGL